MSFTNVKNLTTFGGNPVKISCARCWCSVYLVIFRNKAFKFSLSLRAQISPVNGEGGGTIKKGEGVCQTKGFT